MAEHWSPKPSAVGSIPSTPINKNNMNNYNNNPSGQLTKYNKENKNKYNFRIGTIGIVNQNYTTPITRESTSYVQQVRHIFESVPQGMPTLRSCMRTFGGMTAIIVISAIFLSICDNIGSSIIMFLLGVKSC